MTSYEVCRICLAHDIRMYTIGTKLHKFYEKITNLTLNTNKAAFLCFICYYLLRKYQKFTTNAIKAHEIYKQIWTEGAQIADQNITKIDTKKRLLSTFIITPITHTSFEENIIIENEIFEDDMNNDQEIMGSDTQMSQENKHSKSFDIKLETTKTSDFEDNGLPTDRMFLWNGTEGGINVESVKIEEEDNTQKQGEKRKDAPVSKKKNKKNKMMLTTEIAEVRSITDNTVNINFIKKKKNKIKQPNKDYKKVNKQCESTNKDKKVSTPQQATKLPKGTPYVCDVCGKRFFYLSKLRTHSLIHTGQKPYKCVHCGAAFSQNGSVFRHIRNVHLHHKLYKCMYCDFKCPRKLTLINHEKVHTGPLPHKCNYCEKRFHAYSRLSLHLRKHTGETQFTCDYCGQEFIHRSVLTYHIKEHMGIKREKRNIKKFICDYCGHKAPCKANLRIHIRIHTGEKPYLCMHCGKRFTQSFILKYHLRMHENEKELAFSCIFCKFKCNLESELTEHEATHNSSKYPFECNSCGKRFRFLSKLGQHSRTHTGAKPFACKYCGRRYTSKNAMNRHMQRHEGDTEFACYLCTFRSDGEKDFKEHMKTHM